MDKDVEIITLAPVADPRVRRSMRQLLGQIRVLLGRAQHLALAAQLISGLAVLSSALLFMSVYIFGPSDSTLYLVDENDGWVVLAPGADGFQQYFRLSDHCGSKIPVIREGVRIEATANVNIREHPFGTMARWFLPQPRIVGHIASGECVRVNAVKQVGFGEHWLHVSR